MAKAALLMMTKSLALELGPEVRVNAVAPGAILWPEAPGNSASRDAMLARTPLGRTGTSEEVAEAVRWLLQDATYSTGQVLHLDGGRLLAG
jgi:pteridine reductase